MKKCLFYFIIALICIFFAGCTPSYNSLINQNISEQRETLFVATDEYVKCTFMSGLREEPYEINGVSNKLVQFGVFTITVLSVPSEELSEIAYEATVNGKVYTGILEKSPFEQCVYAGDIGINIRQNATISLFYVINQVGRTINLENKMTDWVVNCAEAKEIASRELKNFISEYVVNNKLNAEIYVKIASDASGTLKPYYWLVQVVGTDLKTSQVVIDPFNKEVLVKTSVS